MKTVKFQLPISLSTAYTTVREMEGWAVVEAQFPYYVSFQYEGNGAVSVIAQNKGNDKIKVLIVNHHYKNHQLKEVLKAVRTVINTHASVQS